MILRMHLFRLGDQALGLLDARAGRARGKCSFMRPVSAAGKKSVPATNGIRSVTQKTPKATHKREGAVLEQKFEHLHIAFLKGVEEVIETGEHLVETGLEPMSTCLTARMRPAMPFAWPVVLLAGSNMRESSGTSVREST